MSHPGLSYTGYACHGPEGARAPDLVLLHGWGLHSRVWDGVLPHLREYFRVTCMDLPGMGRSAPFPGRYDLDGLCALVSQAMPSTCHLLGWSLGGLVAMRLADQEPDRVDSLTTVAASPKFVAADHWPGMSRSVLEQFMMQLGGNREGTLLRFLALNCVGSSAARKDMRVLRDIFCDGPAPAPSALHGGLQILMDVDLRHALPEYTMPVCMLFGDNDAIVPRDTCMAVKSAGVKNGHLSVLEDCAHIPLVSRSRTFLDELMRGWQRLGVVS